MSQNRPKQGISLNRRVYPTGYSQTPRNRVALAVHVNCPDPQPQTADEALLWPTWRGYW